MFFILFVAETVHTETMLQCTGEQVYCLCWTITSEITILQQTLLHNAVNIHYIGYFVSFTSACSSDVLLPHCYTKSSLVAF